MKNPLILPIALSAFLLASAAGAAGAADGPSAARNPDDIEINKSLIEKKLPCYTTDLKGLVTKAECRIKKIEARLTPGDYLKAAKERIGTGDALLAEGNEDGAIQAWQEALGLTEDPAIRKMVEERATKLGEERSKKAAPAQKAEQPPAAPQETTPPEPAKQEPPRQEPSAAVLHESWYKEEKKEKTPEPEQLGVGAIIDKRR